MRWLAKIPTAPLAIAAILLALAPFQPEPHLWGKLNMLMAGELTKPVDIFDLLFHATPLLLLLLKLSIAKSIDIKKGAP